MKTKLNLKLISVTVVLAVTLLLNLFYIIGVNADDTILLGDVNNDGTVTIRDATIIQMYLVKLAPNLNNNQLKSADVNEDGTVNILDVSIIQRYKVGINTNTRINQYIKYIESTSQSATDSQWLPGYFD